MDNNGRDNRWIIRAENGCLVVRDYGSYGDHRYAFAPLVQRDYGSMHRTPAVVGAENETIATLDGWSILVENTVLVLRDTRHPGDYRHAFFPGSGIIDFGTVRPAGPMERGPNGHSLYKGARWVLTDEKGVLVLRDLASHGDHRYAFYAASGLIDML